MPFNPKNTTKKLGYEWAPKKYSKKIKRDTDESENSDDSEVPFSAKISKGNDKPVQKKLLKEDPKSDEVVKSIKKMVDANISNNNKDSESLKNAIKLNEKVQKKMLENIGKLIDLSESTTVQLTTGMERIINKLLEKIEGTGAKSINKDPEVPDFIEGFDRINKAKGSIIIIVPDDLEVDDDLTKIK